MPHTLTFTLKQHTPILHFQHDQDGATLRASEVKPKLDHFILKQLRLIDKELFDQYADVINAKNFPTVESKRPSNYKLFIASKNLSQFTVKSYFSRRERDEIPESSRIEGGYFGENHVGRMYGETAVKIFSFNSRVADLVFESLKWLFLLHNFGCRGSKGFGSYTWSGFDNSEISARLKKVENLYLKVYAHSFKGDFKTALKNLNDKYQILKSGRNVPGEPYEKSRLFRYLCSTDTGWEKRWIKLAITEDEIADKHLILYKKRPIRCGDERNEWEDLDDVTYKFTRALLGLSDKHEYLIDDGSHQKALRDEKIVIKIEPKSKNIERFRSPLTFKVIDNSIYVFAHALPNEMFESKFSFKAYHKDKKGSDLLKDLGELSTPSKEEFDLVDFLNRYLQPLGFAPINK